MSFRTTGTLAAFSFLALAAVAHAQAPPQTSTRAPAPSGNEDPNSLLAAATAGNAQAQFLPPAIEWAWKGYAPKEGK